MTYEMERLQLKPVRIFFFFTDTLFQCMCVYSSRSGDYWRVVIRLQIALLPCLRNFASSLHHNCDFCHCGKYSELFIAQMNAIQLGWLFQSSGIS